MTHSLFKCLRELLRDLQAAKHWLKDVIDETDLLILDRLCRNLGSLLRLEVQRQSIADGGAGAYTTPESDYVSYVAECMGFYK